MRESQREYDHTDIPNEIVSALARYRIPGEQSQCLCFILLQTLGSNKRNAAISLSQFERATGLDRKSICRALKSLSEERVVLIEKSSGAFATATMSKYRLKKLFNSWCCGGKTATIRKNCLNREMLK